MTETETETRKNKIRVLMGHIARNAAQYVYDSGAMELWKTTDPEKVDEFWKLYDWFDHCCALYMEDKVPWDRDFQTVIEVIQTDPDSTPVSVPIKRYDFRPCPMGAARDFFVFMVLP